MLLDIKVFREESRTRAKEPDNNSRPESLPDTTPVWLEVPPLFDGNKELHTLFLTLLSYNNFSDYSINVIAYTLSLIYIPISTMPLTLVDSSINTITSNKLMTSRTH